MSLFDHLVPRPADALLGLMAAFRADPREDKIDLGVGIYRTDEGNTPIMAAVRAAEHRLAESSETKAYEGPRGNLDFCAHVEQFVLGGSSDHVLSYSTPGGCGALSLAMTLVKRTNPNATAWISTPTWPNHNHIATVAGLRTESYSYAQPADKRADLDAMIASLHDAKQGDLVIIQGPCHNPTGIDLTTDEWRALGKVMCAKNLIGLIDIAYHGFAISLAKDMDGVHTFLRECPEALISYSCSKNFGLYRDRTGALLVTTDRQASLAAVHTHLADISRATYSMPPAHGPAIVATILTDEALTRQWKEELTAMRIRMQLLRDGLATALQPRSNTYDPASIRAQNGMFSQLPFVDGGIDAIKTNSGIYIPDSGRLNIAGLTADDIPIVAEAISPYL